MMFLSKIVVTRRCMKHLLVSLSIMALLTLVWFSNTELREATGYGDNSKLADFEFQTINSTMCQKLLAGDQTAIDYATNKSEVTAVSDDWYIAADCSTIRRLGYLLNPTVLPDEERQFPIAFQFLVYKDVWQFERLLRAVYRPQNFYCVHVDLRAEQKVVAAIGRIASCFPNVSPPDTRFAVDYGKISQTQAEVSCMRRLYYNATPASASASASASAAWKYLINLTGHEFPLKTMWQLVRILKALNGSNAMEGTMSGMRMNADRYEQLLPYARKYNITPVKGATHVVVVRGFVQYLLEHPIAVGMLEWLKSAPNPDETLFPTLNHNAHLGVPGSYLGLAEVDSVRYPFINRLKNWGQWPCHGRYRHSVCVWGVGDLPFVTGVGRVELFLNKVEWNYQPATLECLHYWYWKKTEEELRRYRDGSETGYNTTYYSSLHMATWHI